MYNTLRITAEEAFMLRAAHDIVAEDQRKPMRRAIFDGIKKRLSIPRQQRITISLDEGEYCMLVRDATTGLPLGTTPNPMTGIDYVRLKVLAELDMTDCQHTALPVNAKPIGNGAYTSGEGDNMTVWFPQSE